MIWNGKAVNRSSNCNPGSQSLRFENSLLVVQRSIRNNHILSQTHGVVRRRGAAGQKIAQQAVVTILYEIYEVDFQVFHRCSDRGAVRPRRWMRWVWDSIGSG